MLPEAHRIVTRDGVTKLFPAVPVQTGNSLKSIRLKVGSEVFETRLQLSTMFILVWQQTQRERLRAGGDRTPLLRVAPATGKAEPGS